MVLAIVLVLLVVGSVVFHIVSPWWFTTIASNWSAMDATNDLTVWVTGIVFVIVNLFVAYCVWRFRYRADAQAAYEPESKKLEFWLTIITTVGIIALLLPGLITWANFVNVPEEALEMEAVGQQWSWSYRFPGEDKIFGAVDSRIITPENPFGMVEDDPNGQDDILINSQEVHLPIDQPVKMLLRSKDVLHNFTVSEFRTKMDIVPGLITYQWLTPTRMGTYELLCEELCGTAHFAMRGSVVVESDSDFRSWLDSYPTHAEVVAAPAGDPAGGQALYALCTACHGPEGQDNPILNSPKISGQSAWYLRRSLQQYKSGVRGTHEDDLFGQQMAPMAATLVDDAAINDVVAYINTLPDEPAPITVVGDIARGEKLYQTCAYCHGGDGQGIWSVNAPRLSGISDWYLVRQLSNFKSGIRGTHPADTFGAQMSWMTTVLSDEAAINDVVAYINTL